MGDRKEKTNIQIQITVAVGLLSGFYVQLLPASCPFLQKRQGADVFACSPHALLLPRLPVLLLPSCRAFLLPMRHECSSDLTRIPVSLLLSPHIVLECHWANTVRATERAVSLHLNTVTCIDTNDWLQRKKKKGGIHKDLFKGASFLPARFILVASRQQPYSYRLAHEQKF